MGASRHIARVGAAVLAAALWVGPAGAGVVPGASAKVAAASLAERHALAALPSTGASSAGYRRAVDFVNAAVSDLRAAEAHLAAYARTTGPLPDDGTIQRLLSNALAADSQAGTSLDETLWLTAHGAPPSDPPVREVRTKLHRALSATLTLQKLLS